MSIATCPACKGNGTRNCFLGCLKCGQCNGTGRIDTDQPQDFASAVQRQFAKQKLNPEALPDLYAACSLIVTFCEPDGKPVDGFRFREGIAMAHAALALADGRRSLDASTSQVEQEQDCPDDIPTRLEKEYEKRKSEQDHPDQHGTAPRCRRSTTTLGCNEVSFSPASPRRVSATAVANAVRSHGAAGARAAVTKAIKTASANGKATATGPMVHAAANGKTHKPRPTSAVMDFFKVTVKEQDGPPGVIRLAALFLDFKAGEICEEKLMTQLTKLVQP